MSDVLDSAWPAVFARKREECPSKAARNVTTETQFRNSFETLCEEYREFNCSRLEANLQRQIRKVATFAAEVDSASSLEPPNNLTGLLWTSLFAIFQVVCEERVKIAEFLKKFKVLNDAFPTLGPDLPLYHYDIEVQQNLQNLFFRYLDYHDMVIAPHFTTCPGPLDLKIVFSHFETASAILQNAKDEWEKSLGAAAEREKLRMQLRDSTVPSSLPSGMNDEDLTGSRTNVHFKNLRWLGKGGYGAVYEAKEVGTGQVYARKVIQVAAEPKTLLALGKHVKNEVDIMLKLRHHHISSVSFWSRDLNSYSIFMLPVADFDLGNFLETECTEKGFPANVIRSMDSWFGCLVSALAYAHNESVKHEDIKPSNILIRRGTPFLADFGSAKDFSGLDASTLTDYQWAGTPVYYAPEDRPWGRRADVFALGCVFSEMITVRMKRSREEYRNFRRVSDTDGAYAFRKNIPKLNEWLDGLAAQGPAEHLGLVIEQTKKMLMEDVQKRPDARVVKRGLRMDDQLFCNSC